MGLGSDLTDPGSKDELSDQIVTFTTQKASIKKDHSYHFTQTS